MDVMHQVDAPGGAPEHHSSDDYDPWLSDDRDVVVRALDLGPDPAVVLEVARDGSQCPARVTWASVAFTELVGLAASDVVGKRLDSIEEPAERAEAWAVLGEALSGPGGARVETVSVPSVGGDAVEMDAGISPLQVGGVTHHLLVVLRPASRGLVAEVNRPVPHHDPVTGLPDRSQFMERLHHSLRPLRSDEVAVLILSVDGLDREAEPPLRDRGPRLPVPGAPAGELPDEVGIEVAERLRAAVRGEDLVARVGPTRFAVVCDVLTDADEARRVLRRIRRFLASPIETGRELVSVAVSYGVAVSHPRDQAEAVLARAEAALAVTPIAGRAGVHTG